MKSVTLFVILILNGICAFGQNLIGFSDTEIKKYMQQNHKEMNLNNVTNSTFKYLKYSDGNESQTLLFFLDRDLVCQSVRLVCDTRLKEEKVKEFNSIYRSIGENKWIDTRDGREYSVEISDRIWSCVINILPTK